MPDKISISDDDIKAIVKPELDRARDWAEQLSDERKRCREMYDMAKLGNEVEGFSHAVASTVFEAVEWLKPGLCEIFTHDDFFTVKMQDAERGDRIRKIVRHQLFTQQDGGRIIREYLDTALKYHNSVLKVCYVDEYDDSAAEFPRLSAEDTTRLEQAGYRLDKYDEVTGIDPTTMQPVMWLENVKATHRAVKFRGPKVMPVPPWEFFISPGARDIDTAPLVAHCVPRTMHDIKVGENAGVYRKGSYAKLLDKADGGDTEDTSTLDEERREQYEEDGLTIEDALTHSPVENKATNPARPVKLWEIYTRLDIDADGLLEPVIVRMCEGEVIAVEENPYKRPPFRVGRVFEVAHRFEGKALPLVLEHDQRELTNLGRMFVDAAAEAAYPTAVSNDEAFQRQWADRAPGDSLLVTGPPADRVVFERAPASDPAVLQAIEMLEGRVERKSGVSRYNQGLDADSLNKTATGISIIASAGGQRQKHYARVLGEALRDVIRDMIRINAMWPPHIEDADLQPEAGLFGGNFSIEIEVGVGPQDRMAQSQFLLQHQEWITKFGIPSGAATVEHAVKTQSKIGKLQGVPFDDLMLSPEDAARNADLAQKLAQAQQQIEQMGKQMQQMQGQLAKAKQPDPQAHQMELGVDMQKHRDGLQVDLMKNREKLGADMQMQRERMATDAMAAALMPQPKPMGGMDATA